MCTIEILLNIEKINTFSIAIHILFNVSYYSFINFSFIFDTTTIRQK